MSPKKPVALLLTPVLPLPLGSGRALRAWDWLCMLTREHQVHVLLASASETDYVLPLDYPAQAVWNLADELIPLPRSQRLIGLALPFLVLLSRRFMADWLRLPEDATKLRNLADRLRDDSVVSIHVFRLGLFGVADPILKLWPNASAELDMDDVESTTRFSVSGSLLRLGKAREALYGVLVAIQYFLIERLVHGPYQSAWLASPDDCQIFTTRLACRVGWRPNRLKEPPKQISCVNLDVLRLVFIGTLNYPPNEEAVCFLLNQVHPLLRGSPFNWQMNIVGRHADERLKQLIGKCHGVNLIDDADDLAAIYAETDVALVPIRAGGGTKLKTLEAFAHNTPVISTEHGVRGLGAIAGTHYLLAKRPHEFAQAIRQLAQDRSLGSRLGQAGNALWREAFKAS